MQTKTKILSTVLTVFVSVMLVAGAVMATSTIGTNIVTTGSLTVGTTSTLTGAVTLSGTTATGMTFSGTNSTAGISFTGNTETLIKASGAAAAAAVKGIVIGTSTVGGGIPLSATNWQGNAFFADDGGVALTAGSTENLNATYSTSQAISGNVSASSITAGMNIGANYTSADSGGLSGIWGVTSITAAKTVDTSAGYGDVAGGHFSINLPSTAVVATGSNIAGISVGGNLGGTHDGKVSAIRIRRASAGDWDYGIDMNDITAIGTADIRLSNGATISNATNGIIKVLGGTLQSGASNGGITATAPMVAGYGLATAALSGDLIGVYGDARVGIDSASGMVMGGYFKAVNGPVGGTGYDADTMRGVYIDTYTKNPSGAAVVITSARALEANLGLSAVNSTVTNAYGIYLNITTDTGSSTHGFTDGYGLWIQNEGVGGYGGLSSGKMLNAGIYLKATNVSTPAAFNYGIDMSGAAGEIGTADIRLSNGETISNTTDNVVAISGGLRRFEDTETVASSHALTVAESGKTFYWSGTGYTLTLPAVSTASGVVYRFVVGAAFATNAVVQTGNTLENKIDGVFIQDKTTDGADLIDCRTEDTVTFVADGEQLGDWIELRSNGSAWFLSGAVDTAAKITCSAT